MGTGALPVGGTILSFFQFLCLLGFDLIFIIKDINAMKNCKKCGIQFEPQKGLINYCSLECRNSRTWSEEDKEKKSISAKNSSKVKNCNNDKPKDFWLKIAETRKKNHYIL